jgi:hypothetical protein
LPLKIISANHSEAIGRGLILLANSPATSQSGELYTGRIVEEIALQSKAHALVGAEPKISDSSTSESLASEFAVVTHRFVEEFNVKYTFVILGKNEPGVEIRSLMPSLERDEILGIVRDRLASDFDLRVTVENEDEQENRAGKAFPTLTIALGPEERGFRKDRVVSRLADIVSLVNARLGDSGGDE